MAVEMTTEAREPEGDDGNGAGELTRRGTTPHHVTVAPGRLGNRVFAPLLLRLWPLEVLS